MTGLVTTTAIQGPGNTAVQAPFGISGSPINPAGDKDLLDTAYAIQNTDQFVNFFSSSSIASTIAVTLPLAASNLGRPFTFNKIDSGVGGIAVTLQGSDTLNGFTAALTLLNNGATVSVVAIASGKYMITAMSNIGPTVSRATLASSTSNTGGFNGSSTTYTTPAYVQSLEIELVGGGGGGSGSGSATGTVAVAGGSTTFGTSLLTGAGGGLGVYSGPSNGGGAATVNAPALALIALTGGQGNTGGNSVTGAAMPGGGGGTTAFGGGGAAGGNSTGGLSAAANSGAGGGGGAGGSGNLTSGSGGSAGGYLKALINNPSSTYTYAVGTAGTAGGAGTSGLSGGTGALGVIIVKEIYH